MNVQRLSGSWYHLFRCNETKYLRYSPSHLKGCCEKKLLVAARAHRVILPFIAINGKYNGKKCDFLVNSKVKPVKVYVKAYASTF